MTYDRFKAEQDLLAAWNVTADLSTLAEGVLEHELTPDQVANITIGLADLYNIRMDKVWRNFEASIAAPTATFEGLDELIQIRSLAIDLLRALDVREADHDGESLFSPNRIICTTGADARSIKETLTGLRDLLQDSM